MKIFEHLSITHLPTATYGPWKQRAAQPFHVGVPRGLTGLNAC